MAISVFTVTMTSGQLVPTSGVNLGQRGWKQIALHIPSSLSGSVGMVVSNSETGSYYPLLDPVGAVTSPVASSMQVDSGFVTGGAVAMFPGGFQFIKPKNSSGVTDYVKTFKIICSD